MPDTVTPAVGMNGTADKSVVQEPFGAPMMGVPYDGMPSSLTLYMSGVADLFPIWGTQPRTRDAMLRAFWPTEPLLASAIWTIVSKYASYRWILQGPARTSKIYQNILQGADFGRGWQSLMTKVLIDLLTQDNGSFIEIVRMADNPTSPAIALNHLDAGQCIRTQSWDEPVIYWDIRGRKHLMKWYQVIPLAEMSAPVDRAYGAQYCAVTRMLRAAQVMKSYSVYKNEKISGKFQKAIHLVSGVQRKVIEDAIKAANQVGETAGTERYMQPLVIASLDPNATVSSTTLELASMPDGFDEEKELKNYITTCAMAFAADYSDFAPLPGGGLGSATQAKTMHMKSRGKGAQVFMNLIQHALNYHGVLPDTVTFSYDEQDLPAEMDNVQLRMLRAQERQIRIMSGEITKDVARQMALMVGDLTDDQLAMMGQDRNDPDVTADSVLPVDILPPADVDEMTEADTTPAATGTSFTGQPNSNLKTQKPDAMSQKAANAPLAEGATLVGARR